MIFNPPLKKAIFLRRYKRFLADIRLDDGREITIHCPNTGSMKNCLAEGSPCWYSTSDNPKRKYAHTWEIATTPDGDLAGINTHRANALVREALDNKIIPELSSYNEIFPEVKYGEENSRIDFLLRGKDLTDCYLEVKNVTLADDQEKGLGLFPDAVSTRGTKHLRELITMKAKGHRAVLLFCVQHTGIDSVSPADNIDPDYGYALRQAITQGLEVIVISARLGAEEISLLYRLELILPTSFHSS